VAGLAAMEYNTDLDIQVHASLRSHDDQPGRYVLPQLIVTPVG
jgi:hypothetical protein